MKRYYVYPFCLADTILIDTVEKTFTYYGCNIWGQYYNLEKAAPEKLKKAKINGFIRRTRNYDSFKNGKVIDPYIYHYILTDEERAKCERAINLRVEPISSGDNLKFVLMMMCQWGLDYRKGNNENHQNSGYYHEILERI